MQLNGPPLCRPAGTAPLGMPCGIPGNDGGAPVDDCEQGTICLPDISVGSGQLCQALCHTDADCKDALFSRCAEIITDGGAHVPALGVCMRPCTLLNAFVDCGQNANYACRFELHSTMPAQPVQPAGVCMQTGMLPIGSACIQAAYDSECSNQEACIGGICHYLCDDAQSCTNGGVAGACIGLVPTMPNTSGYCENTTPG